MTSSSKWWEAYSLSKHNKIQWHFKSSIPKRQTDQRHGHKFVTQKDKPLTFKKNIYLQYEDMILVEQILGQ